MGVAPPDALASPAMAYRILEFPLDFSCLSFPVEGGKQYSQGHPFWVRVEFLLGKRGLHSDGVRVGGSLSFLLSFPPHPLLEPGNRVGPCMLTTSPRPALPSAGWAGARLFQGATACRVPQGPRVGCWQPGRLGAPGSLSGPPCWTGFCSPLPALEYGGSQLHLARRAVKGA